MMLLYFAGKVAADIPATKNDDAPRLGLLMTEGGHDPGDMLGIGDEIDIVAGQQVLRRIGHEPPAVAHDTDNGDPEVGEQLLKLA